MTLQQLEGPAHHFVLLAFSPFPRLSVLALQRPSNFIYLPHIRYQAQVVDLMDIYRLTGRDHFISLVKASIPSIFQIYHILYYAWCPFCLLSYLLEKFLHLILYCFDRSDVEISVSFLEFAPTFTATLNACYVCYKRGSLSCGSEDSFYL